MQYFLRMIENIRLNGVAGQDVTGRTQIGPIHSDFLKRIPKVQPIVFTPNKTMLIDDDKELEFRMNPIMIPSLDAPFQNFSIETTDGSPIYIQKKGDGLHPVTGQKLEIPEQYIYCTAVFEFAPKAYRFLCFFSVPEMGNHFMSAISICEGPMVEKYISRLNSEKVGSVSTRTNFQSGSGSDKQSYRLRRVVYVSPKTDVILTGSNKDIDWSHRWLVRGHWRTCEGKMGKDREGLYCVNNYTWVTEHEKGPEDKPLIKKVRIVK